MKSIFSSSFLPQRNFFMGQAAASVAPESIQYGMDIFNKAQAWLKTHDARSWLGPNTYPTFQSAYNDAQAAYGDMPDFQETLTTGGTLSDSEIAEANKFISDAGAAWGAIRQTPVSQAPAQPTTTTPSTPTQITQAATTAAKAIVQAKTGTPPTPVKPAPAPAAPASDLTTPLAIGGAVVALAVIVSLVK